MEDHAIFKVSSKTLAGTCKCVSDYPKPSIRERIIRQVFDPPADCSQMGTVNWYITNTTEEPTGLCENSSSSGVRAFCSFLFQSSEWRMVIHKEKSAPVIPEILFLHSLCFPLGLISTLRRNKVKSCFWGSAQTGSSTRSSQAELVQAEILPILLHRWKPASASSFPIPSGSWE